MIRKFVLGCSLKLFASVLVTANISGVLLAQEVKSGHISYQIPYTNSQPVIDGQFAVEEWEPALKVKLDNETQPGQNIPALVNTDVYLMEDGEHIYLAFVAFDPEPENIRAYYRDRDSAWQDDFVGMVIDTFNDERRAFEFFSNPLGAQMDATIDDVNGGEDASWNAIWDSEGSINDQGYVVEMRIPLKTIRFPSGLEQQTWGIDLLRFYPRDVRHRLANNTKDYNLSCYLCQLKKASGFSNLQQGTNLQVIPYAVAQYSKSRPDPLNEDWQNAEDDYSAGMDVRWAINEDIIFNATINPDFSQVEADSIQLNVNNTFTLFYSERREFFVDGADYFNTQTNLVYTRNIQDPDAGLKLTGKTGNNSYGLMVANDQSTAIVIPGLDGSQIANLEETKSEDLAFRERYDYGSNTTIGGLFTRRQASNYNNNLAAVDFNWRFTDSDRLQGQVMYSDTTNPQSVQSDFNLEEQQQDSAWRLIYSHQGENFRLNLRGFHFGEDFRADLGFINRVGYTHYNINPSYVWRPENGSFLSNFGVWGFANHQEDLDGNRIEQVQRGGIWAEGPLQSYAEIGSGPGKRVYQGEEYDVGDSFLFFNIKPWGGSEISMNVTAGNTIDYANQRQAEFVTLSPGITVQLGKHLQAGVFYTNQVLDVAGGQLYESDLVDLRLTYQFSTRSFVRAIVSQSDTQRNPSLYLNSTDRRSQSRSAQLLYSYRFDAQTRFFLGYSSGGYADDELPSIHDTSRTVFAKFTYAWQM